MIKLADGRGLLYQWDTGKRQSPIAKAISWMCMPTASCLTVWILSTANMCRLACTRSIPDHHNITKKVNEYGSSEDLAKYDE